jgi:hypothetical protein
MLLCGGPSAALPPAQQVLAAAGFPETAQQQVLAGEMVQADVKPVVEREIGVALAFLVEEPPAALLAEVQQGLVDQSDPSMLAHGELAAGAGVEALAGLKLSADELELYRDAKPGADLNLATPEIAAFRAAAASAQPALEQQLRESLLARQRAYLAAGLDGIAAYDRGGKQTSGAADLQRFSAAATYLERHFPAFHAVLMGYPKAKPAALQERFHWNHFRAHGEPTVALVHAMALADGDGFAVSQRQFYVSRGYNVEQALAGFLPVSEGTLVVYVNRTSTDQVTGMGGSAKQSIGRKVMASQLEGLFEKARAAAAKP